MSSSAATTSATSRSSPPSTSTPPRSAATSRRRSSPRRTTPALRRRAARPASTVRRGPTLDGIGRYMRERDRGIEAPPVDVADVLRETGTEVLVSYLPVGSQRATRVLRRAGARGRLRLRQLHPGVHRLRSRSGARRFEERGLPIIGDDIKSQVGATIVHRMLANLFRERGVRLDRTYQLNFGGNTDFLNMLERERLESKKISKTQAVHEPARRAARRRRRPCRPERLRALADRPQMGAISAWKARPSAACRSTSS